MNTTEIRRLGEEFPSAEMDHWRELASKALKGASFDKALVSQTYDGIEIQPLYTQSDWSPGTDRYPGFAPFVRGFDALSSNKGGWQIRQAIRTADPVQANADILKELEGGVSSIELVLDEAMRGGRAARPSDVKESVGRGGIAIHHLSDLEAVLNSVHLEMIEIALDAGIGYLPASLSLIALCEKRGRANRIRASLNCDPLGAIAEGARFDSVEACMSDLSSLASVAQQRLPEATTITVNSCVYHNAGATDSYELSVSIASAVTYLKALTNDGMRLEDAMKQIQFTVAVDADLFLSAAKLRAMRMLWARVAEACGCPSPKSSIHAVTSDRMLTVYDPYTNILRNTTAGFAAVIGGADGITVQAFDKLSNSTSAFSRRIARNTQAILQEESMLANVMDPSGGAWYVEVLTTELAKKAWEGFQDIEREGGAVAALASGIVFDVIRKMRQQREHNVARRVETRVGVTDFPDLAEEPPFGSETDTSQLRDAWQGIAPKEWRDRSARGDLDSMLSDVSNGAQLLDFAPLGKNSLQTPLVVYRDSGPFEALRKVSDQLKANTGKRPTIFLATWGTPAEFTARMTFAKNLFETAGIQADINDGFGSVEDLVAAFQASKSSLTVICSSDDRYVENGAALVSALKNEKPTRLYLAGRPANKEELLSLGVDSFLFAGMDALTALRDAIAALGLGE